MEAGAHVWTADDNGDEAWILCEVLAKSEEELKLSPIDHDGADAIVRNRVVPKVAPEDGIPVEVRYEKVELANVELSDKEREEGMDDDMINLPHLHEPAILHAINERFKEGKIYTWTGPVLIAVNPFQRLPLYTNEILETYRREGLLRSQGMGQSGGEKLPPHIYSIADRSYRQMMAEARKSQSILISGESGAGKTESTKIVMLYLTTLGSSQPTSKSEESQKNLNAGGGGGGGAMTDLSVMERVLQSNPILEAFGNARTLRNDNSSRFGKYIELGFSRAGTLLGARVQTYLLEKVRLGFHASGERNYHIFYQVLRGMSEEQKKKFRFHDHETHGLELANHYHYTGQGGAPSLREFTDEAGLKYTIKAMKALGWDEEKTETVLGLVAGMLHLGQVSFDAEERDGVEVAIIKEENENEVRNASDLAGLDHDKLEVALKERIMVTRGEEIRINLNPSQAADARDALSKTIYGALFLWVVEEVNRCITWENDSDVRSSCGVLDIFGFECFSINSFEQLCINFTNEALQQQFNKFIFKMEQAEYETESINWAFIEFPDNQDCLDTISSRPTGILAMLDDECRLGSRGSDRNWANRLYKTYIPDKGQTVSENTRFQATPVQKSRGIFCVRHFAGLVQYTAETGFLEKNKDEIPLTAQTLLETAPSQLVKDLYGVQKKAITEATPVAKPGGRGKPAKSKTVGVQFKEQLNELMTKIEKTEPHYIRCLKPNDAAKPKFITRKRLTEQLRYGGVLEAVRVARMGYPVRLDHTGFFQRYRIILPSVPDEKLAWSIESGTPQALCVKLVDILLEEGKAARERGRADPAEEGITVTEKIRRLQHQPPAMAFPKTDVQLGSTKVFMRKPPHDILEAHRTFHQTAAATMLQCWVRGLQQRMKYLVLDHAVETAQRWYRGCKGRERWWKLRRKVASFLLTKHFRMQVYRRKYDRARRGTIRFQGVARGHACRRVLASIKIQTCVRMTKQRYIYVHLKSAVLALQCAQRERVAVKVLKSLMGEQKDIGKLKENNEKLKQEMASLKAMLAAQAESTASKGLHQIELEGKQAEIAALEKRIKALEAELEKEKAAVKKLEEDMEVQKAMAEQQLDEMVALRAGAAAAASAAAVAARSQSYAQPPPPQAYQQAQAAPPSSPHRISQEALGQSLVSAPLAHTVSSERLAEQQSRVAKLEEELEAERKLRRDADGEIIKLRASQGGVTLSDGDVNELLASKLEELESAPATASGDLDIVEEEEEGQAGEEQLSSVNGAIAGAAPQEIAPEVAGAEPQDQAALLAAAAAQQKKKAALLKVEQDRQAALVRAASLAQLEAQKKLEAKEEEMRRSAPPKLQRSASDYFPLIRRGAGAEEASVAGGAKDMRASEVVAVGWKVEVTNRKEREEALRDEVQQFESKMRKVYPHLEEGVEVNMWQLNRGTEMGGMEPGEGGGAGRDEFAMKSTAVHVKLHRRGELLVQAVLAFGTKGGYLSKALGRRRKADVALEPLPLHEILDVKAGVVGIDQSELPSSSSSSKSKKSKSDTNRQSSLFLTVKATQTPMASSRFYYMKFKSRSARNELMVGLRGLLGDLQIHEGVSVSSMHTPGQPEPPQSRGVSGSVRQVHPHSVEMSPMANGDIMVPMSEVHKVIDQERKNYDRLLLLLLQSSGDLKEKEDESLTLRGRLDAVSAESAEKDRVQANDSKLIMQLSKKLETLLMDNEDLRDQNDRLNTRLVAVECEKMNLMST